MVDGEGLHEVLRGPLIERVLLGEIEHLLARQVPSRHNGILKEPCDIKRKS